MNKKALQLASRFCLPPNSLGYCGKNTAVSKFKKCIINGDCENVEEEVGKFIVLHPYLKTISQITGLPKFSYKVIESYWIGNDLLKKTKLEHYDLLLKNFKKQGVPDFFLEELKQKFPKKFIPNHLFQVLHIGVGKASGAVPFNLESINNCMIRWGKVKKIKNNQATIILNSIEQDKTVYKLTIKNGDVLFDKKIVENLKVGKSVAVHWNMIIKILTKNEEKDVIYWTNKILESISNT